jgi:hypothetical protein
MPPFPRQPYAVGPAMDMPKAGRRTYVGDYANDERAFPQWIESRRSDSNRRPTDYKSVALPGCATPATGRVYPRRNDGPLEASA